jgi:hypothetical protein
MSTTRSIEAQGNQQNDELDQLFSTTLNPLTLPSWHWQGIIAGFAVAVWCLSKDKPT